MFNCEIELDLRWTKNCIISEISRKAPVAGDNPVNATETKDATFQINNTKLCVPVVTVSINDNIKFLENINQGFKKNNISEIITQPKNNNLDCLIDPTFRNINRFFLHSFKTGDDDYYTPLAEIKDFNVFFDNKPFFYLPVKNNGEKPNEKPNEMSRNNDYTAGNLLD